MRLSVRLLRGPGIRLLRLPVRLLRRVVLIRRRCGHGANPPGTTVEVEVSGC
ncbi:hypothetical protein GZL_00814 [Streptomyces sp. 769]|nr:hypothetical protein GZL_00814 [Streptomyces sp. 769]